MIHHIVVRVVRVVNSQKEEIGNGEAVQQAIESGTALHDILALAVISVPILFAQ
jgi:hypothetical protein